MSKPLILLVDDEPHITMIVKRKLENAGLDVVVANDGEEALGITEDEDITAIVTDLQMPYMSGIELAIELAKRTKTAHTPLIMLTARGYILDDDETAATNIRAVLPKPFSAADLLDRVLNMIAETEGQGERGAA